MSVLNRDELTQNDQRVKRRLAKRYRAEKRFRIFGLAAILSSALILLLLVVNIAVSGIPAFFSHYVTLPIDTRVNVVNSAGQVDPELVEKINTRKMVRDGLLGALGLELGRRERRQLTGLVTSWADFDMRRWISENPAALSAQSNIRLLLDDDAEIYMSGQQGGRETLSFETDAPWQVFETGDTVTVTGAPETGAKATGEKATGVPQTGVSAQTRALATWLARHAVGQPDGAGTIMIDNLDNSLFLFVGSAVLNVRTVTADHVTGRWVIPPTDRPGTKGAVMADDYALLLKVPQAARRLSDKQIVWLEMLRNKGFIDSGLNLRFFTNGASREAERAGIWGAVVGSFLTLLVTLALSFPLGVAAAIYLEEFAPKNRVSDLIEVNINNLAAVPSIIFGLLGLAVFLNFFGLPRSAPIVGGLVLALMTLPTIIIASRAALRAVPPSIREAALALGASPMQTVFHHVVPLALPGMATGTIIGMAQALGETAPLLMIGMVAFIVDVPSGPLDPATVLPVQIYMWADFPELLFRQKTAAAILILLSFLIAMNASAIALRKRFERRW